MAKKRTAPAPKDTVLFIRLSSGLLRDLRQRAALNERTASEEARQAILAMLRQEVA